MTIWQMSKVWKVRPSEFLAISHPLDAYWFDRSVMYFGASYDIDIHDATEGAKDNNQAERAMNTVRERWLRDEEEKPQETSPEKPKFRDPAKLFKK